MKILCVLPYALNLVPGQRYRIEQWLPYLRDAGISSEMLPLLTPEEQRLLYSRVSPIKKMKIVGMSLVRALCHLPRPGQYNAIWLSRTALVAGPPLVEWLLVRRGIPLIYDFDDAIWIPDTMEVNRRWSVLKCPGKTAQLCRMASIVIAGNEWLANYARIYNRNVWVVPSTVDTERYLPGNLTPRKGPVVIGWSGSPSTIRHLHIISGALRRVAAATSVELRVMGGDFQLSGVPLLLRRWSPETEIKELQGFDIGIMPLPDEPWSYGKCGMKALLYMSVGIPVVASPIGVNSTIIQDGKNGFLAAKEDEWVEKLLALIRDPELRRSMGQAGRTTVETEYSLQVQAPRVLSILKTVTGSASG
ncbi:MAG TPA: glycosyltransferase family 4 protein [Candidatus Limnocylindrales bacterium]|nr:glycosyltransferase family 4 protein [Candidatus Limnocylindrales bacterium]